MLNPTDLSTRIRASLRTALPWLLVLAPCAGLFLLIREYRVNIPFLDDWMFVHMFEKEKAGTLTLHDFFMVQMEHRMAFVRAMIMVFHKLRPTDYTIQMFFCWVLLSLTYVNVAVLLRRTTGASFRSWWPVLALAGLAIFSPVQYRIVLWAMMFQVACPAFFLSTALVAITSRRALWLRWVVGVLAASCATQSFATGLLVWLLPLPVIWWAGVIANRRHRVLFTGLWLAAFGVTLVLYFTNLKNEVDPAFAYKQGDEETLHTDLKGFFVEPGRSIPYVLRFLGGHLGRGTSFAVMDASLVIGTVSLLLFLAAGAWCVKNWKREDLRAQLLPWLAFGIYSIGAGSLVAMGRMWASQNGDNAIAPRYVIHAVPLTVSLLALAWIIARDRLQRRPESQRVTERLTLGAAMVLLPVQVLSWSHGWRLMEMWQSSRVRGAVNTRFFKIPMNLEDVVPANRDLARRANDLGLLDPPMLQDGMLDHFKRVPKVLSSNIAQFQGVQIEVDDDGYTGVLSGFACLPSRKRVADGVFFTRRIPKTGRWEIFHVGQVTGMPLFYLDTLAKDAQFTHIPGSNIAKEGLASFACRFSLDQLPKAANQIMAWAHDARRGTVYPMGNYFILDTRGERPRVKRLGTDPASVHLEKFLDRGKAAVK